MSDDLKAKARSQFGASVGAYAASDIHAKGESLALLLELVSPRADWNALDVGTGAGVLALMLARAGFEHVEAVDINPNACESVRRYRVLRLDLSRQNWLSTMARPRGEGPSSTHLTLSLHTSR